MNTSEGVPVDKNKLKFGESSVFSDSYRVGGNKLVFDIITPLSVVFAAAILFSQLLDDNPFSLTTFIIVLVYIVIYSISRVKGEGLFNKLTIWSALGMIFFVNIPTPNFNSGVYAGAIFLFVIPPLLYWLCFSNRKERLFILLMSICGILIISAISVYYNISYEPVFVFPRNMLRVGMLLVVLFYALQLVEQSLYTVGYAKTKSDATNQKLLSLLNKASLKNKQLRREFRTTVSQVKKLEGRLNSQFNQSFDGILVLEGESGKVLEVNNTFCDQLGISKDMVYSQESLLKLSVPIQSNGLSVEDFIYDIRSKVNECGFANYEWRFKTVYNTLVDFNVMTYKVPHDDVVISVFRDITEDNKKKEKLYEVNKKLVSFTHAASHDLKEPLRTMNYMGKLIKKKNENILDNDSLQNLDFIINSSKRGMTLVSDLLEYTEVGKGSVDLESVDLNEVVTVVTQNLYRKINQKEAKIIYSDLPSVLATTTWANQLMQNLISNALKFSKKDVRPVVKIDSYKLDECYKVCVTDNGTGIAKDDLNSIFNVFTRLVAKEDIDGSGIGLSLCKQIMDNLNGKIEVESTLGKGTTFNLYFPFQSDSKLLTNKIVEIKEHQSS